VTDERILSAEEVERRVIASMFGTPKEEVSVLLDHDTALRARLDTATQLLRRCVVMSHLVEPTRQPTSTMQAAWDEALVAARAFVEGAAYEQECSDSWHEPTGEAQP